MIPVGLARGAAGYGAAEPPFGPACRYPEHEAWLRDEAVGDAPDPAYAAVRAALHALGLDRERFGSEDWNPLGELVARGSTIVLKPNFIRHWNPNEAGSLASVVTHGAVLRAAADYAALAAGPEGRVVLAEAPQQDCDWKALDDAVGVSRIAARHRELGRALEVIDLRREAVRFEDGIIVERRALPGDPLGYRAVDLGTQSFFEESGIDPERMRGADYDPAVTSEHHRDGRNEYLLSETVLQADLVVNLPKLKTHKKTGVTLALKNLVGINGDKNWLPHHTVGAMDAGGDEFPGRGLFDRARSRAADAARGLLKRGLATGALRAARRIEKAAVGDAFIRAGNWHGNNTTWRMCVDLNRCLYYSDAKGLHLDAPGPVRPVLTVLDGIVAGEGEGPLAPGDVPLGVVLAGLDPVAVDLAAVRLMGFDERRIPKLREPMRDEGPRITAVRDAGDVRVRVVELGDDDEPPRELALDALAAGQTFRPHSGWTGHIERSPS